MLEIDLDTVCFIIARTRMFQAQEAVSIPATPDDPADDWGTRALSEYAGDPVLHELRAAINDLEPDQQVQLVALMWLGRGDFGEDEWQAALERAQDEWNEHCAEYLIATPLVADYLTDGLEALGYSCDE